MPHLRRAIDQISPPRIPTVEELDALETLWGEYRPTYVAVWDHYMSDSPGYTGWVAVAIGGEPDIGSTFTKTPDGFIEICENLGNYSVEPEFDMDGLRFPSGGEA